MEKLFENKTTYTKNIYMEFLRFHTKTHNLSYIAYTVFWSLIFLLCICLSFKTADRIQGVIITIVLIGFVSYRIYNPKRIVTRELESDKISTNNTNTFTFYDKNFEVKNNNGSFKYRYFMLHKVFETNDFFYLYVNKENAFLVSKEAFSYGTSEDFSKFIKNKCKFKYKLKKG